MAHTVWNPVIYCYMNSRFRDGFRAAVSNVPCVWKMVQFCQFRGRSGHLMGSGRRGYCSANRLTRTNTSCTTTYTFGSVHNLHGTSSNCHHHLALPQQHHHNLITKKRMSSHVLGHERPSGCIVSHFPTSSANHFIHNIVTCPTASKPNTLPNDCVKVVHTSPAPLAPPPPSSPPASTSSDEVVVESVISVPMRTFPKSQSSASLHNKDKGSTCLLKNGGAPTVVSSSVMSNSSGGTVSLANKDVVMTIGGNFRSGKRNATGGFFLSHKRPSSVVESFM